MFFFYPGLSPEDVALRRRNVGFNEFKEEEEDPLWKKYLGQVSTQKNIFGILLNQP